MAATSFAPDHAAFLARIRRNRQETEETAEVCRAHLNAHADRIRRALAALDAGHLGSARAYLEIGRRDYTAAIASLPQ